MNVLLDTHILLWSQLAPEQIGRKATELLEGEDVRIWVSPVSIWEGLVLAERGRVALLPDPVTWMRRVLKEQPLEEAPLNVEVAIQSRLVRVPHQDPADRFLAATAAVYELTLLTADERLLRGSGYSVLPNR